jgi:Bacterial TSP3 repeat
LIPGISINWTSENSSANQNDGGPDQKLMNGFLRASRDPQANPTPAALTISGIPFSTYHIFAYVGGGYDCQKVSVTLNAEPSTTRTCYTMTTPPRSAWVEIPASTEANPTNYGNFARYPGRTASSVTINTRLLDGYGAGIHAVQIIDATLDADVSGIPDWYEMQYALQPATAATANADPDGDTLSNLQEFQRGSNPGKADTDGDGLADNTESAHNALSPDSDADGLGDYAETTAPLPSDPNLADSDGDGLTDKRETELGLDPTVNPTTQWAPSYTALPARWEWKIEPVQLVWDHRAGAVGGNDGYDDTLLAFFAGNIKADSRRSLDMRLRYINGALTYRFESFANEAFSRGNEPDSNIYLTDGNNPPTDLKAALGFSGYGAVDISDRLGFRMFATRGAANLWSVTFEIHNITRNTTVISRLVSQSTATASLDNGTAAWQNNDLVLNLPTFEVHEGSRLFITPTPLETLPAFSAHADNDNDGMPNAWEDTHQFNKTSAGDATQDADGDGLNNRDEYLAGTHPRLTDTDGDGVDDRVERIEGSNPLLSSVRPTFANGVGTSGTDFNQNGLPDAWETRFKTRGIAASADNDGDGASNATEAAWGTDPFDPASQIALALEREGNDALLAWTRSQWKRQRIYRSSNLSSWQWLSAPFSTQGENSMARLTDQFSIAPNALFTVETKDRDSDGDGVADWDEVSTDSDPFQRDSTRSGALTLDSEGNVNGSVSGDYASFTNRFRNGLPGGPGGQVTREQAARFLQQASFGPTMADLDQVQTLGFAGWIDNQIADQPRTLQRPVIEAMIQDLLDVAGTPPLLLDRVNLLFCGGMMSATTRATLLSILSQTPASDPLMRVQLTVFIASACPEGAVQR